MQGILTIRNIEQAIERPWWHLIDVKPPSRARRELIGFLGSIKAKTSAREKASWLTVDELTRLFTLITSQGFLEGTTRLGRSQQFVLLFISNLLARYKTALCGAIIQANSDPALKRQHSSPNIATFLEVFKSRLEEVMARYLTDPSVWEKGKENEPFLKDLLSALIYYSVGLNEKNSSISYCNTYTRLLNKANSTYTYTLPKWEVDYKTVMQVLQRNQEFADLNRIIGFNLSALPAERILPTSPGLSDLPPIERSIPPATPIAPPKPATTLQPRMTANHGPEHEMELSTVTKR